MVVFAVCVLFVDELAEIKEQLASTKVEEKKDALKKVIALMTIEKDVSKIFIDIVNCMQQGDIEMKKLVYLYLINYADEKPDLALLAVQSFIRVFGVACCSSIGCF